MTQPPADPPPPGDQTPPPTYERDWPAPPPPVGPPPRYDSTPSTSYPAYWNQQNLAPVYVQTPRGGTNGFAIAALVFGIIPICFLGIVFAIVALVQTSKSGQKGKGLAITGLVLSVLWITGAVTAGVLDGLRTATYTGVSQPSPSQRALFGLEIGDCVNGLANELRADSIEPVDCAEAHEGEVFAIIQLPSGSYPGLKGLKHRADTDCFRRLEEDHPEAYDDKHVSVDYVYPSGHSWVRGDRELTCLVEYETRRAGSIDDAYLTGG